MLTGTLIYFTVSNLALKEHKNDIELSALLYSFYKYLYKQHTRKTLQIYSGNNSVGALWTHNCETQLC